MIIYESEVSHSGVKGMKWGVRKAQNKTSSGSKKAEQSPEEIQARRERVRNGVKKTAKTLGIIGGVTLTAAALTPAIIGGTAMFKLLAGTYK